MSNKTINRLTMFKIPKAEDQDKVLEAYAKLTADQSKDGKPYILSSHAYKVYDDARSLGYTICAQLSFSSLDDMHYYDDECAAHKELKTTVKPLAGGPPLVLYMDA